MGVPCLCNVTKILMYVITVITKWHPRIGGSLLKLRGGLYELNSSSYKLVGICVSGSSVPLWTGKCSYVLPELCSTIEGCYFKIGGVRTNLGHVYPSIEGWFVWSWEISSPNWGRSYKLSEVYSKIKEGSYKLKENRPSTRGCPYSLTWNYSELEAVCTDLRTFLWI